MARIAEAAEAFLAHRRIAVTGVSRNPEGHGGNAIYDRLIERGFEAVPVNPQAATIGDAPCYPDLRSIPEPVGAVVIATRPEHALATVEEAAELGITHVWMHGGFGSASVDKEAAARGRELGLTVIDGGCPLMFGAAADGGHAFMCKVLMWAGKVPRTV